MAETDFELLTKMLHQLAQGLPDATILSVFRQIERRVDKTTHLEVVPKGEMDKLRQELEEERQKEKKSPYDSDAPLGLEEIEEIIAAGLLEVEEEKNKMRTEVYADVDRQKQALKVAETRLLEKVRRDEARMKANFEQTNKALDQRTKELDTREAKLQQAERDFATRQSQARRPNSTPPITPRPRI